MLAIDCKNIPMEISLDMQNKARRIDEAIRRIEGTKAEIAREIGISAQSLGASTKNGKLSYEKASKLAKLASLNPEWIMTGKGEKEALEALKGLDVNRLARIMDAVDRIAAEGDYSNVVKSAAVAYFYSLEDEEPPKKAVVSYLDVHKQQEKLF